MGKPLALINRNFFLLWQGQLVSQMGNQLAIIASILWLKEQTNSATLVAMMLMLSALPAVILGPFGGTFADHYSRRNIIILSDVFCGGVVLGLAGLFLFASQTSSFIVIGIFLVSIFISIIGAFFKPAISASIPDIVPSDQVGRANSIHEASEQLSVFIGYALGGILYQILGAKLLFLINGVSYLLSAYSESFIHIPQVLSPKQISWRAKLTTFQSDTISGIQYIWKNTGLRTLFVAAASLNFFAAPVAVLLPFYVELVLHVEIQWYGFLMASFGAGILIGYGFAGVTSFSGNAKIVAISCSVLMTSSILVILGFITDPIVALLCMLGFGACIGFVGIVFVTILQLSTPSHLRGRVFGLLGTVSGAITPLGMGLSGLLADWTERNIALIYLVSGICSLIVTLYVLINKDLREFLQTSG